MNLALVTSVFSDSASVAASFSNPNIESPSLGVTTAERVPAVADIPPLAEVGVPGGWAGSPGQLHAARPLEDAARIADELFAMAHFVGVTRPGHQLTVDGLPGEHVSVLEIPALAISSTDIRARAQAGKPVWYLVPDGVVQYIAKYGLYRGLS